MKLFTKEEIMKLLESYWKNKEKRKHIAYIETSYYINICEYDISHIFKEQEMIEIVLNRWVKKFNLKQIEKDIDHINYYLKILAKKKGKKYTYYIGKCFGKLALLRTKSKPCINYTVGSYLWYFDSDKCLKLISTDQEKLKKLAILWRLENDE